MQRDPIIETPASSRRRRRDRRLDSMPAFVAASVLALATMGIVIAVFLELVLAA